ncbi:zinc ribbon domain-containing protein [Halostella litorea]|uniref:zinc ribbon domain-containing protein n=1 Tax=Halostella litorea TaxID=2528831 RepID=UPI00138675C6|nr:zinc ribbon domain-containing protein [Halostella litorea]
MVALLDLVGTLLSLVTTPLLLAATFAVPFGGYWLHQRYPTVVALVAGGVAGVAVGYPLGSPVLVGGLGAAGATAGVAVRYVRPRGVDFLAALAAGLALGRIAGESLVAFGVMAALAAGFAAAVARYRRATLVAATAVVGSTLPVYALALLVADGSSLFPPYYAAASVFSLGLMGLFAQPLLVERSDTIPPLLPRRVRSLFGFAEAAAVDDAVCPDCDREVDPSDDACPHCGASLVGVTGPATPAQAPGAEPTAATSEEGDAARRATVPDDAVAVDIACQHCGERPIEELAKGYRVTGFLLAYRITTVRLLGCHACNRRRLWGIAGKNLLTGWWSISAIVLTPFATLYALGRSLYNRGPTSALAEALNDAGIDYDFLPDADAFDPSGQGTGELHMRALIRIGCATMLTDGEATTAEATAIRDATAELYPDCPTDEIEDRIRESADSVTNAVRVARGLGDLLTPAGKEQALRFAAVVAAADDEVDAEEVELLERVADAMEMSDADVERALTGEAV